MSHFISLLMLIVAFVLPTEALFAGETLSAVNTEVRKALIYDIGKTGGTALFTQETNIDTDSTGKRTWSSKIKNSTGDVVMTEKATMKNEKIVSQYVEQLQIGESYELSVEGNKATFSTYKMADGKIVDGKKEKPSETKVVDVGDNFITGPLTEFYLQSKWSSLVAGETIHVDFGVFELSKAVGFKFKKTSETDSIMTIEMKPSNFFISLLVKPIELQFEKARKRMVHFKGRTPLREKIRGQWKVLDSEIVYP